MKNRTLVFLMAFLLLVNASSAFANSAEDYEKLVIKQGMHEKTVTGKYGQPLYAENIKDSFWPIPKKKALYRIGESDYMILSFFSRRVSKITILTDVDLEYAKSIYEEQ